MKDLSSHIVKDLIFSQLNVAVKEDEDQLKAKFEKYGEKWVKTTDLDDQLKKIDDTNNKSNLKSADTWLVNKDHYIIKFYGGLNGSGKWKDYLKDIQHIVDSFKDCYLIDLDIDVPDDVWILYIGINKK